MKILQINSLYGIGSTGKICKGIGELLDDEGIPNVVLCFWGKKGEKGIKCSNIIYEKIQAIKSRVTGEYGFVSKYNSKRVIQFIEKYEPDIVHLHNIHDHTLDLKKFFSYLKARNIRIVWTFHDCWAFTGYCAYFTMSSCNKWRDKCDNCPIWRQYSWFNDKSKSLFERKKMLFSELNLTIVTPSQWLSNLVKDSFLKKNNVQVINNGIDLSIFYPRENNFRKKYNVENKFIILGVAFAWEKRKGIDVFIKLSEMLDEDFQIVLVGSIDKVREKLPSNIIAIQSSKNQVELAEIYSASDLFLNPSKEDNFPTVNLEALACGTPILTYDTGGCSECIDPECGIVVEYNDFQSVFESVLKIKNEYIFSRDVCRKKAHQFNQKEKYKEYVKLYKELFYGR